MSTVEEIKEACLTKLTVSERAELMRWLAGQDDEWDRQIEKDAESGKLDFLFREAEAEREAGTLRDWPKGE